MNKTIFLMPLLLLSLAGCSNETSSSSEAEPSYEVKWATPTGAPTLAFYNQASNENWLSSSNPAKDVLPHFADNAYDALVFDGSQALTNIATNNRNYVLAEWISGGTFYVVSTQHDASKTWDSKPRVDAFMNMGNVSKAFRDLAKNAWSWNTLLRPTYRSPMAPPSPTSKKIFPLCLKRARLKTILTIITSSRSQPILRL